jgi:hypothetical protein
MRGTSPNWLQHGMFGMESGFPLGRDFRYIHPSLCCGGHLQTYGLHVSNLARLKATHKTQHLYDSNILNPHCPRKKEQADRVLYVFQPRVQPAYTFQRHVTFPRASHDADSAAPSSSTVLWLRTHHTRMSAT